MLAILPADTGASPVPRREYGMSCRVTDQLLSSIVKEAIAKPTGSMSVVAMFRLNAQRGQCKGVLLVAVPVDMPFGVGSCQ